MSAVGERPTSTPGRTGTLALGSGVVVYDGRGASADRHRHDAIQLVIGIEAPARLDVEGREARLRAALVPPRVDHELVTNGRTVVVLVEPTGPVGAALAGVARDHVGVELIERVGVTAPADGGADAMVAWSRRALANLSGLPCAVDLAAVDPVVLEVASYVDERLDGAPRLTEAAELVAMSPRQLRRVLATELGMPFRRYVLWRRLRRVVLATREGHDLTAAAAEAGFADSAHLSRVFRSTFGLVPSAVLPVLEVARTELDALDPRTAASFKPGHGYRRRMGP